MLSQALQYKPKAPRNADWIEFIVLILLIIYYWLFILLFFFIIIISFMHIH
jgi:hypothetical protein